MHTYLENVKISKVSNVRFIISEAHDIISYVKNCLEYIDNGLPKQNIAVSDIMDNDLFESILARTVAKLLLDQYSDIVTKESTLAVTVDIASVNNKKYNIAVTVIPDENNNILLYGINKE
jgi:hypothetical protein